MCWITHTNKDSLEILLFNEKWEDIIGKHEIRSLVSSNLGKSLNLSSALVSAINKMKANTLDFSKLFSRLKSTNSCEVLGTITVNMCKHIYEEKSVCYVDFVGFLIKLVFNNFLS